MAAIPSSPVWHGVPVYSPPYASTELYCFVSEAFYVNYLPEVALYSEMSGIELVISSRKSQRPDYYATEPHSVVSE